MVNAYLYDIVKYCLIPNINTIFTLMYMSRGIPTNERMDINNRPTCDTRSMF